MATRATRPQDSSDSSRQTRAYFAAQTPSARQGLRRLEAIIRQAAPGAQPVFSYGIPGFRFDNKALVWYAAWPEHWSMYPITPAMRTAGGAELVRYAASKGTLHFPVTAVLPTRFITRLVKARVAEIVAASRAPARARSKTPTKRRGASSRARSAPARST